jgi:hypothetical protein
MLVHAISAHPRRTSARGGHAPRARQTVCVGSVREASSPYRLDWTRWIDRGTQTGPAVASYRPRWGQSAQKTRTRLLGFIGAALACRAFGLPFTSTPPGDFRTLNHKPLNGAALACRAFGLPVTSTLPGDLRALNHKPLNRAALACRAFGLPVTSTPPGNFRTLNPKTSFPGRAGAVGATASPRAAHADGNRRRQRNVPRRQPLPGGRHDPVRGSGPPAHPPHRRLQVRTTALECTTFDLWLVHGVLSERSRRVSRGTCHAQEGSLDRGAQGRRRIRIRSRLWDQTRPAKNTQTKKQLPRHDSKWRSAQQSAGVLPNKLQDGQPEGRANSCFFGVFQWFGQAQRGGTSTACTAGRRHKGEARHRTEGAFRVSGAGSIL